MKIGIYQRDVQQIEGGAYSFEAEVVRQLLEVESDHEFALVTESRQRQSGVIRLPSNSLIRGCNFVCKWLNRMPCFDSGGYLREQGIDLLYSPQPFVPCFEIPFAITCWDLQHRLQPYFPESSLVRSLTDSTWTMRERFFAAALPRASAVITGTERGKSEIAHFYRVAEERIHVNPFPVPSGLGRAESRRPDWIAHDRFLLYPAQFWPHKNHYRLIKAIRRLHDSGARDIGLVLPGADKSKAFGTLDYVRNVAAELGVGPAVTTPGFVSNEELRWLYEHALALVFASFYGPDNIPPLEAMALDCPVIAADVPGAREQLGEAALFFDPLDESALVTCVDRVLGTPEVRQNLVSAGRDLSRDLSGLRYAETLCRLFDRLAKLRAAWA